MDDLRVLAYIDPGSGSILLQLILSGIFAGFVFFGNQIRSLLGFRLPGPKAPADAPMEAPLDDPEPGEEALAAPAACGGKCEGRG
jgi:hypothetical protein